MPDDPTATVMGLQAHIRDLERQRDTILMQQTENDIRLYVQSWEPTLIATSINYNIEQECWDCLVDARKQYLTLRRRWLQPPTIAAPH